MEDLDLFPNKIRLANLTKQKNYSKECINTSNKSDFGDIYLTKLLKIIEIILHFCGFLMENDWLREILIFE